MTDANAPTPDSHTPTDERLTGGTGYQFGAFEMTAPANTTLEELKHPSLYRHIAPRLTPGCIIRVQSESGIFYAEILVRSLNASRTSADVVLLPNSWQEPEPDVMTAGGVSVIWMGGQRRWSLQMATGDVVRDGIATRQEAVATLKAMVSGKKPAKAAA